MLLLPITSFIVILLLHLDTVSSFSLGIIQENPRVLYSSSNHLQHSRICVPTVLRSKQSSDHLPGQILAQIKPRMPELGDAGWPAHWYNNDRHIPCLAQRCDKVFHTSEEFKQRRFHWNNDVPLSRSYHDHKILLAMNTQTRCVWCNYQNNSLKDLLYHERKVHEGKEHGTSNMSSIEGYLSLMRSNRTHDDANACKVHAFERMVINIGTLQEHHDALCVSLPSLFLLLIALAESSNRFWDSLPSKHVFNINTNPSNKQY